MANNSNDAAKAKMKALRLRRERGKQRTREWRARGKDPQVERRAAKKAAFAARAAAASAAVDADAVAAAIPQWAREMEGGIHYDPVVEQAAADEAEATYWDWVTVKGMKRRKGRGKLYFNVEWDDRDGGGDQWVREDRIGAIARVWDWLAINILDNRGIVSAEWDKWRGTIEREWRKTR